MPLDSKLETARQIADVLAQIVTRGLSREQRAVMLDGTPLADFLSLGSNEMAWYTAILETYQKRGNDVGFAQDIADRLDPYQDFKENVRPAVNQLRALVATSRTSSLSTRRPDVFVIMPYGKEQELIYESAVRPTLEALDCDVGRADDERGPDMIIQTVYARVSRADFLVAIVGGRNANVWYELGYAHGLLRDVVILLKKGEEVPSDLKPFRYLRYDERSLHTLKSELRDWAEALIAKIRNP